MKISNQQTIGVVGGMGPMAGNALTDAIFRLTNAATDQDHLPVMMISFPGLIADRTAFLYGNEKINPAFGIASLIRKLEGAGAGIIGIACNTSHVPEIFHVVLDQLKEMNSSVQLLNMPIETCLFLKEQYPSLKRIGVMATNGTWRSELYTNLLQQLGYEVIRPDPHFQQEVIHRMIYDPLFGIKANSLHITNEVYSLIRKAIHYFQSHRTEAIILGCTELSIAMPERNFGDMIIIDSTDSLARALIREATC